MDWPRTGTRRRVGLVSVKRRDAAGGVYVHRRWPETDRLSGDPPVLWIPAGRPVVEADGRRWSSPYPVICWLWPDRWYHVMALCREDGIGYYCNVATPPEWDPAAGEWRFVDLELDVRMEPGGEPAVMDREEFEAACREGRIAAEERKGAEEGLRELLDWALRRRGPFDPAEVALRRREGESEPPRF